MDSPNRKFVDKCIIVKYNDVDTESQEDLVIYIYISDLFNYLQLSGGAVTGSIRIECHDKSLTTELIISENEDGMQQFGDGQQNNIQYIR
jgi:hypothetical protein